MSIRNRLEQRKPVSRKVLSPTNHGQIQINATLLLFVYSLRLCVYTLVPLQGATFQHKPPNKSSMMICIRRGRVFNQASSQSPLLPHLQKARAPFVEIPSMSRHHCLGRRISCALLYLCRSISFCSTVCTLQIFPLFVERALVDWW